jgi:hypothetical protein
MNSRLDRHRTQFDAARQPRTTRRRQGSRPQGACNQLQIPTAPQIHYREWSHGWGLQPFSFDAEVFAATAKQDRIHVSFGSWTVKGTTDEIDALRELMASPCVAHRNLEELAESGIYGRFFFRPQKHGSYRPPMSVRDRPLPIGQTIIPPPLFSGRWAFSRYARDDDSEVTTKTHLELWLKPNVFVRHQSFSPWPDLRKPDSWPVPRLFGNELPKSVAGEASYDGGENWLCQNQRFSAFTNPTHWPWHLRRYLDAITEEFEADLHRLNNLTGLPLVEIEREENATLYEVETYWEFSSDDPIKDVLNLRHLFLSLAAGLRRIRFHPNVDETVDSNCVTLTADISPGEQLRIYAKTNRRVRVEVIHTVGRNKYRVAGGRTTQSWDRLPEMIENLAEDAAATVRWTFEHFRNQTCITPSNLTADDLLLEIGVHSRDASTAKTIRGTLVEFGGIAAAGNPDRIARALQRLTKSGVLEYRRDAGRGGNYVVTAMYRRALQELRERENSETNSPIVAGL